MILIRFVKKVASQSEVTSSSCSQSEGSNKVSVSLSVGTHSGRDGTKITADTRLGSSQYSGFAFLKTWVQISAQELGCWRFPSLMPILNPFHIFPPLKKQNLNFLDLFEGNSEFRLWVLISYT
jgi:hypothetical protein